MQIEREKLLVSTQRALLGAIGLSVLAISINNNGGNIVLTAYVDKEISDYQREALEMASSEIIADFPYAETVSVDVVVNPSYPIEARGIWVFIRLDCQVA